MTDLQSNQTSADITAKQEEEQAIVMRYLSSFNELDKYFDTLMDTDRFMPYNDKLKQIFSLENRKPQIKIDFGKNNKAIIGDENVMFRHDKTFVNPCCYAIELYSDDKDFSSKLKQLLE